MPYAALLRRREPNLPVLLVELLNLFGRRPRIARDLLPNLLQEQTRPDLLPELVLGKAELIEGLLEGLIWGQVLAGRRGLLADLLLGPVYLLLYLLPRHLDAVLPSVSLGQVEGYKLGHDLRLRGLELRRARADLRHGLSA